MQKYFAFITIVFLTGCGYETYAAIGDSYSLGFDALRNKTHLEYSFASGTEIESIGSNFKETYNFAIPGATSYDALNNQLKKVIELKPQFVTVFLAGNDMRYNISPSEMENNLDIIFKELQANDIEVISANMPNIIEMRKAPYDSCKINMIRLPSAEEMAIYGKFYNEAIYSAARKNGIKVVDIYANLGLEDISDTDCIHPSKAGHIKIARLFYDCWKNNQNCVDLNSVNS